MMKYMFIDGIFSDKCIIKLCAVLRIQIQQHVTNMSYLKIVYTAFSRVIQLT